MNLNTLISSIKDTAALGFLTLMLVNLFIQHFIKQSDKLLYGEFSRYKMVRSKIRYHLVGDETNNIKEMFWRQDLKKRDLKLIRNLNKIKVIQSMSWIFVAQYSQAGRGSELWLRLVN